MGSTLQINNRKDADMRQVKKIVLTGGPCAGKSEVLRFLQEQYGQYIVFVTEMATILFSGGFPRKNTRSWQEHFQRVINVGQLSLEHICCEEALDRGVKLVVCDRGSLDNAPYLGGVESFCQLCGLDVQTELNRYAAVYHLESLATACPNAYGNKGNLHRSETLEEAQLLEHATRAAWSQHPRYMFIGGSDLQYKIETVSKEISTYLEETS